LRARLIEVTPVGVLVDHLDLRNLVALEVQVLDPFLNLLLVHLLQLLAFSLHLLLDVVVCLGLELCMDFSHDGLSLLLLVQSIVVLVLHQQQLILKFCLLGVLLDDSGLRPLDLLVDLFLLGEAPNLQMTTLPSRQEMSWNVLVKGVFLGHVPNIRINTELVFVGQVVFLEDFVLAI
jgi:hypothetical protein